MPSFDVELAHLVAEVGEPHAKSSAMRARGGRFAAATTPRI